MDQTNKRPEPDQRISKSVQMRDDRVVLDLNGYIPYFLTAVYNAISSSASALYLKEFGIGIMDWRVLSTIAFEPGIPASHLCDLVALDKAAVSRSLHKLESEGYLDFEAAQNDPRRKNWSLNARGFVLHDRILKVALDRERKLIEGIEAEDLEAFLRVMRQMRRNVTGMG
jgi:DNA-binding MarR family transcriptional regulator